ncbi:hypothetical protein AOQ73_05915 [Bradyrhizobium pachyrhizi]|uniref:hypothetical protein n=1 Tax=Bradyrhizobium pachyrhizi TaxID=280333 RepID=UPI00070547BA|nr:hypothetical protein [Bradyrhizobium pachyrhizi]KRQ11942.1 hypothetical protein AOQ73_05915 [Bradyrhizobium pachyrhizi]
MATFELTGPDGGVYHVDAPDEKAALSAFSAFNGGKSAAPPPDKYQQAAIDEAKSNPAIDQGAGFTRRLAHGATLGADSTVLAAAATPFEMIKHGTFSPVEGYNYAKAREDRIMDESRAKTGMLGSAAEMLGGAVTGGGLANAGVTAARALAPEAGLVARSLASAADAGGLGAISGFNEGNGITERLTNAAKGAGTGALVGGLVPGALAIGKGVTAPIFANIRARANPEGYAASQVARAVTESGQTPQQLGRAVEDANAAGQPFTLADALGNPGQRMLSTVTRAPGEGRTEAVRFLNERQAGQADRVGDIIDTGLGAGGSARQTVDQLTAQARRESAPLYRDALNQRPVWNDRMQEFFDDPITARGLREGVNVQRLESLANGNRFDPHDYAITSFNEAGDPVISGVPNMRTINLIKKGWDNILEGYRDPTTGRLALDEHGRALDRVRRAFLSEVDSLNPTYAQARAAYGGPAQVREAVGIGADAAKRGRAVDNLDRFDALPDAAQQGFRHGYADTRLTAIERAPQGTNVVRPLTSQKAQDELGALSLHQGPVQPGQAAPMQQLLNREQTMFETRAQALGNSKTAENLADDAAMAVDPHLVSNIITGNWHGALRNVLAAGHTAMTGNTPAVRAAVGRMLLDQGVNPANLQAAIGDTVARIRFIQNISRNLGRGAAGALAVSRPGQTVN